MLKDLLKKSFNKTNDCIILVVPLIIFATITELYSYYVLNHANTLAKSLVAFTSMLIMFAGFSASWFYMAKKTLELSEKIFVYDKDRIKAVYNLFLSLPEGLGKLFLHFLGMGTIYFCLILIPWLLVSFLFVAVNSATNLPVNEILLVLIFVITNYLLLFSIPELVYKKNTPISALVNSFQKVIKLFPKSLFLYLLIILLYVIKIIFYYVFINISPYLLFFALILNYYVIIYSVILIFLYYETNFPKE